MKKIILILLLFLSFSFAAETAYAWGYGDLIVETFKVVKYVFSMNEFNDVWKITMIISLIAGMIMMMSPNPDFLRLGKIWVLSMGVYTMFTAAKIDIYVEDKVDNNNSGLVTNVPWAVGYPLGLFSAIEYRLGATYEVATSIPNGMKYSDSGFFTPISIFSQATKHQIVSPYLYQNLTNYIQECVMPDLENGYKDYRTLIDSDNVWAYLGNTSPATFILISDEDNNSSLVTCPTAYSQLNSALQNYVGVGGTGMEHLGKTLGSISSSVVSSQLGVANQYLLNTSKTASQMLLQNVAINTFSESFRNYVNTNGGDLNNVAYHSASASQAASAQMIVSGILGSRYIPVTKGILTTIIIGLTPILALIMITPMGLKALIGYVSILFFLTCWHFGDVILNHIITTKAQSALSSYGDIKFNTRGLIDSTTMDYINMASSMYWMIPTIAFFIASGFGLAGFVGLGSGMSTKLDRTASVVGGDMAKGNMQFGNVSHDTYSANKNNAIRENNFGQNTTYRDFSSGEFGTQSNTVNGKATQSGTQSITGGIGANESYNSLMSGMGKSLDFNSITGDSQAAGKDLLGNQIYQATSSMSVSGNGVNGTISAGSTYTQDKNGEIHLLDASLDAKNLNGESIESTFKGGMEHKRTMTDSIGNKMESTTMENGVDKTFNIKTFDGKTDASGEYYARSNTAKVISGKVDGLDINKSNSTGLTVGSSTIKSAMNEIALSENNQTSTGEKNSESNSEKSSTSNDSSAGANATLEAKWFGNGVGAKLETAAKMSFGNDNTVTATYENGKTETFALSKGEKNALLNAVQRNATEEEKMSASRDLMPKELEARINKGLEQGLSISDSIIDINRNKDDVYSSNKSNVTQSSKVQKNLLEKNLENDYKDKTTDDLGDTKNRNQLIRASGYGRELNNLISQTGNIVPGKEQEYADLYNKVKSQSNDGQTKTINQTIDTSKAALQNIANGVTGQQEDKQNSIKLAEEKGYIYKNADGKLQVVEGQEQNIRNQMSVNDINNLVDSKILSEKGDGNIRLEPGLEGLEGATKLIATKQEKRQPIEEVKEK